MSATGVLLAVLFGQGAGSAQAAPSPLCLLNPIVTLGCATKEGAGAVANKLSGTVFEKIVNSLIEGYDKMLQWALAWWIKVPSPDLSGEGATNLLQKVNDYTFYIQVFGLITSIMFVALRMTLSTRGLVDETEEMWRTLARAVFASSMLAAIIAMATKASDMFSNWLLMETIGDKGDTSSIFKNIVKIDVLSNQLGLALVGLIVFLGALGAFIQLILLVVRQAMLIVVVCALPIAAASSGTGPGSQSYQKLIAWSIAFLLFKPVGAIVYMIAFTAAGSPKGDQDGQLVLLGVILLGLVGLVLPSLMRLRAPAVGAMGSGGSGAAVGGIVGGIAGAGAAKAGTMATSDSGGGSGGGPGGGGGGSALAGRSGPSPTPPPPPPSSAGKHAALGQGKAMGASAMTGGAGAAGGGAGGVAGGPIAMAATEGLKKAGQVKDATYGAALSEADSQPNPTGDSNPSAPSMSTPHLVSGTGENRMSA